MRHGRAIALAMLLAIALGGWTASAQQSLDLSGVVADADAGAPAPFNAVLFISAFSGASQLNAADILVERASLADMSDKTEVAAPKKLALKHYVVIDNMPPGGLKPYYRVTLCGGPATVGCTPPAGWTASSIIQPLDKNQTWHLAVYSAGTVKVVFPRLGSPVVESSATLAFTSATPVSADAGVTPVSATISGVSSPEQKYFRVQACLESDPSGVNCLKRLQLSAPAKPAPETATQVYVMADPPSGVNPATCGSLVLGNPCSSVQGGVNRASNGYTVLLTPGMYWGAARLGSAPKEGVDLQGKKITLTSTHGQAMTMLNGRADADPSVWPATRLLRMNTGETRDTVITDLTLAEGTYIDTQTGTGGGCILIFMSEPTLRNITAMDCSAAAAGVMGGAIFVSMSPPSTPNFKGPLLQDMAFYRCRGNLGADIAVLLSKAEVYDTISVNTSATLFGLGGFLLSVNSQVVVRRGRVENAFSDFAAGGMLFQDSSYQVEDVTFIGCTGLVWSGAMFNYGSSRGSCNRLTFIRSTNFFFGGGFFIVGGDVNMTNMKFYNNNGVSGGAVAMQAVAKLLLADSEFIGNQAASGGALIASQGATHVEAKKIKFKDNRSSGNGGAILHSSASPLILEDCIFEGNGAASGGAIFTSSAGGPQITKSQFRQNSAQSGGALFLGLGAVVSDQNSIFEENTAELYGGAIAISDGATFELEASNFTNNGMPTCSAQYPPERGGAIMAGIPVYSPQECGASLNVLQVVLKLRGGTSFTGNRAMDRGGALYVEAGSIHIDDASFDRNQAMGGSSRRTWNGVGGALSFNERCPTSTFCVPVIANVTNIRLRNNSARLAGGAVGVEGRSAGGMINITDSLVRGNKVDFDLSRANPKDGVGGGMYIGRPRFRVNNVAISENEAYYGAGLFISADLDPSYTSLSKLTFASNTAAAGPSIYWLQLASPGHNLTCATCTGSTPPLVATEARAVDFTKQPPTTATSNQDVTSFSVAIVDTYGRPASSENGGICAVTDTKPNSQSPAIIRSLGSRENVDSGVSSFNQLQIQGRIGTTYALAITCETNKLGRNEFLRLSDAPALPSLALPLTMSPCPAGTQANRAQDACVDCAFGTFNFVEGSTCSLCPDGATCPGGAEILTQDNWWRSSNSSAELFSCKTPGVCKAGPLAGDASCEPGQHGPLCAICDDNYYKFSGGCRSCKGNSQAQAMLALSVTLLILVVTLMFARDWDFGSGPGILTKIKIMLTHFQMMSLFRDYDLSWPQSTQSAFSWFEFLNVGLSITAPECFIGSSYSFYWFYVFTMVLPFISVGMCVLAYAISHLLLKRLDPTGKKRLIRKGLVGWLAGLQIRSWKNAFWFVTLLYPRCAMTALQLFGVQRLDTGYYLTVDFSIMTKPMNGPVNATYIKYMVPGIFLLILFAAVIPAFWFLVLWYHRNRLEEPIIQAKFGFLYSSYSRSLPYWETTEMIRKFLTALLPVFIKPQSEGSLQGTVAQIMIVFYMILTAKLRPFANPFDNYLQLGSLCVLFLVLLSGAAAKWAQLSDTGDAGLAAGQLLLTAGVAFIMAAAVFWNGYTIIQRLLEKRRTMVSRAAGSNGDIAAVDNADDAGSTDKPGQGVQLTIKVKARATNDSEGGGAAYTTIPAGPSPDRGTPRGDDTPRHGDTSPLLKKHSKSRTNSRAATAEGSGAQATGSLSPRGLPPASTFNANPRVEDWIAGSEASYDIASLAKHVAEKERAPSASPRKSDSRQGHSNSDPLNLSLHE